MNYLKFVASDDQRYYLTRFYLIIFNLFLLMGVIGFEWSLRRNLGDYLFRNVCVFNKTSNEKSVFSGMIHLEDFESHEIIMLNERQIFYVDKSDKLQWENVLKKVSDGDSLQIWYLRTTYDTDKIIHIQRNSEIIFDLEISKKEGRRISYFVHAGFGVSFSILVVLLIYRKRHNNK